MKIRKFSERDRSEVKALWNTCGLTRPWNDPDKDIDRKMSFQPDLFFVCEVDNVVVGSAMAGYDGHRGSLFYLAVLPSLQGESYGQQLMSHAEQALQSLGCPKLNIVVRSSNDVVLGFYNKLSYSTDDVVSLGKRLIIDV